MTGSDRRLQISRRHFDDLIAELRRRGAGQREAGAFLLARRDPSGTSTHDRCAHIVAVAYYDDLDPNCLTTGAITFNGAGYAALNARCRTDALQVVGDIHTHPSTWVQQSTVDATHPMVAIAGHTALIAPNYGRGRIELRHIGVHVFEAPGWTSYLGDQVGTVVTLTGTAKIPRVVNWVRKAVDLIRDVINRWRPSEHA